MIGQLWNFIKVKFKAKLYVFLTVFFSATLFLLFRTPFVQIPSLLICFVSIPLMAIFLVNDTVYDLKEMILMIFKKKVILPVPLEVANLAKTMGVTCKSFNVVPDNFNAFVLPNGKVFIGDITLSTLNKDELLAVFSHEFAHSKKNHHLLKLSALLFLLVAGYCVLNGLPDFIMVYALVAFTSIVMIPISWHFELEADNMGKVIVGAEPMISALEKISINHDPNEGSETHPPINARIRALKAQ